MNLLKGFAASSVFTLSLFGMELSHPAAQQVSAPNNPGEEVIASAQLEPKSGSTARGSVIFTRIGEGMRVTALVEGVDAGKHGLHVHEKGDCSDPHAKTAGDHYNPTQKEHGGPHTTSRHLGDFGNVTVGKDGKGRLELAIPFSAQAGISEWEKIFGKSVILHAEEDDLKTQPSGDSGDRIACGIIVQEPRRVAE